MAAAHHAAHPSARRRRVLLSSLRTTIADGYPSIVAFNAKGASCMACMALGIALALVAGSCVPAPLPLDANDGWDASGPQRHANGEHVQAWTVLPIAEEKRQRWPYAGAASEWTRIPGRERSDHGGGAFDRTVRIDALAQSYATLAATPRIAEGARVLEDLIPIGGTRAVAIYAMRKLPQGASPQTNDWAFTVLDPELRVAAEGDLGACARCHADAPHAGWFGPPALTVPPATQ